MPTFAALCKSGWPRMGYPFSLGQRFICADKLQHALQKWVWPAGHLLSLRRERRQRGAKGDSPLGTPDGSVGFLFRKASPTRTLEPGENTPAAFCILCRRGQKDVAAHGVLCRIGCCALRGQPDKRILLPTHLARHPFLVPEKKGDKKGRERARQRT